MQKYTDVVTSARSGSAIPNARVTVKTYPAGVTATIYSDDGSTQTDNPITTDSNGEFEFYAADGEYTLTVSGTGITERTIGPILLHDPADADDFALATDVSFTQSGSGASSRGLQAKVRELCLSLADFGADLTGATAADTAWANCLAEAKSGSVKRILLQGTILITQEMAIDSDGIVLVCDDATINCSEDVPMLRYGAAAADSANIYRGCGLEGRLTINGAGKSASRYAITVSESFSGPSVSRTAAAEGFFSRPTEEARPTTALAQSRSQTTSTGTTG
jgi:hypothetical protein